MKNNCLKCQISERPTMKQKISEKKQLIRKFLIAGNMREVEVCPNCDDFGDSYFWIGPDIYRGKHVSKVICMICGWSTRKLVK